MDALSLRLNFLLIIFKVVFSPSSHFSIMLFIIIRSCGAAKLIPQLHAFALLINSVLVALYWTTCAIVIFGRPAGFGVVGFAGLFLLSSISFTVLTGSESVVFKVVFSLFSVTLGVLDGPGLDVFLDLITLGVLDGPGLDVFLDVTLGVLDGPVLDEPGLDGPGLDVFLEVITSFTCPGAPEADLVLLPPIQSMGSSKRSDMPASDKC